MILFRALMLPGLGAGNVIRSRMPEAGLSPALVTALSWLALPDLVPGASGAFLPARCAPEETAITAGLRSARWREAVLPGDTSPCPAKLRKGSAHLCRSDLKQREPASRY